MRRSSRQHLQQQQQISSTGQDLDSSSSSSHPQLPPILSYPPSNSSVTSGGYPQQQQQGGYPQHRADELGRHESYLQQQQYEQQLASNQPQHLQQFEHQQHQPLQHQQQFAEQQQQQHQRQESISSRRAAAKREPATDMLGTGASGSRSSIDDSMPSASDFVKKLYKMLEDQSIANVVSWGPQGDCFVVKDMNEFTKTILPRLFKHSNFASFVRQLNKYDFHKVKNGDDNQYGEHSWTFRHQNFHADRREDLENIKRKVPAGRKPTGSLPPVSTTQPHTSQPLSSSSSSHHQRSEYPYRRGSQSRHHSPSPYGGPPSPGSYEYSHGGYDHDSGYDRHRHGGHHHHSSSYDHLQQQLSALQSQLTGLSSSTSALSAQLRALAESQQSLGRDVENVRGEVADVRRRESEIRDEMRRGMLAVNGSSAGGASLALSSELSQLSRQTTKLTQDSDQMGRRVGDLERGYKNVLGEVGVLQRGLLGAANTASTLSLGGAGANGAGSAAQSLEEMLKSETGVGLDSMAGVEASTPGSNYWGVRGLVGGWLEGSNNGQSSQGRGEGSSSSPNLGGGSSSANPTSDPSSDNASRRQQGLDSSNASPSLSGGQPSSSSSPTNPTSAPTAAANASTSSSSSGRPAFNIPVNDDSRNQFLPMQLPPDAAKASLVQLNELSRRADQVGFSLDFSEGFQGNGAPPSSADGSSSWQQQQQIQSSSAQSTQQQQQGQQQRSPPTSKIWEAANNAGLFGNGVGFSYPGTSNDNSPSAWPDTASFNKGGQGSSSASSATPSSTSPTGSGNDAVLSHEGLQVYTVGHLVPRDQLQLSANQWTFGDPTQQQQQQYPGGSYRQPSDGQFEEFQQGSSSSRPSLNNSTSAPPAGPSSSITEVTSPTSSTSSSSASTAMVASSSNTTRPKLRVRRSTFVPGWAVPPRVLLVDDDAVSRKLGSKFLQVFGCTIDVAVDGVGAVNKMNLEKYDLVLMDIVMPKLDGISATSLIRKFDPMTPIISMTSNSKPSEIMTYYSSGMNDILPKPFTKEGMLDMLEKHLTHLRIIQQMSRGVPPSVGIPPLSDAGFQQALQASATNLLTGPSTSGGPNNITTSVASSSNSGNNGNSNTSNTPLTLNNYEDDGRINPLAGMGLSDDQYNSMLQNMVNGDPFFHGMTIDTNAGRSMNSAGASGSGSGMPLGLGFGNKRGYEESSSGNGEDGREGKRSRFEVIE